VYALARIPYVGGLDVSFPPEKAWRPAHFTYSYPADVEAFFHVRYERIQAQDGKVQNPAVCLKGQQLAEVTEAARWPAFSIRWQYS